MSVIFISHKLNEVLEIADRITRRCGAASGSTPSTARGSDRGEPRADDGRPRGPAAGREAAVGPRRPVLTVDDLHVVDDRGLETVRGVSFEVRAGEIVGIAGVDGNGQTELIDAITGLRKAAAGTVAGRRDATSPAQRPSRILDSGPRPHPRGPPAPRPRARVLARRELSRCTTTTSAPDSRCGWLFPRRLIERARELLTQRVRRARRRPQTRASALSGGNQQKVVLAREIGRDPQRPDRRPADARARRRRDRVRAQAARRGARPTGTAVLLVSLELEEILSLSDRILVIYEGEIVAQHGPDVTEDELGIEMTGAGARRPLRERPRASRLMTRPDARGIRADTREQVPSVAARLGSVAALAGRDHARS